jgi:prepilin-type N-terminal cleavage/methylation domain-containing protein
MTPGQTSRLKIAPVPPWARGFTLVELLLVLALLLTVLGFAAPTLARFFRGRDLDAEALRFLALTRYGQSRAVSEGVPMILWVNPGQRRYGLEAEYNYTETDDRAQEFAVADDLEIEVSQALTRETLAEPVPTLAPVVASPDSQRPRSLKDVFWIRFTPEGFLAGTSPEWVAFRQVREGEPESALWVAQSRNRLRYEIHTNQPPLLRR